MNQLSKIIFIIISLSTCVHLHAREKLKVAVIDFKSINVPVYYATIAKTDIESFLINSRDFVLIERSYVDIVYNEMLLKKKGCDMETCKIEVGKSLSADLIITGVVQSIGDEKKITIKIINVNNSKIISANAYSFKDDKEIKILTEKAATSTAKDIQKFDITKQGVDRRYEIYVSAGFNYAIPYMALQKLLANGYGFNLDFGLKNDNFLFGLMTGFSIFNGRNDCNQARFFPVLITAGYNINIFNFLSITPGIGAGVNISSISYKNNYIILQKSEETLGVNPLVRAQINLDFSINSFIKLQIGVGNSARIEKNEILPFMDFKIGALIIF